MSLCGYQVYGEYQQDSPYKTRNFTENNIKTESEALDQEIRCSAQERKEEQVQEMP